MTLTRNLSFQELKERVSIIDVATHLGYTFDRSKGIKQPSYHRGDADRIYIKNPSQPVIQGYWNRAGERGDVITFVANHLSEFSVKGNNELDKINKVLHQFARKEINTQATSEYHQILREGDNKFDPSRWKLSENNKRLNQILSSRSLDSDTIKIFAPHIHIIEDMASKGEKIANIGFPYKHPEDPSKIVGYEIRGTNGFKAKASGTDSTRGMWIADFSKGRYEAKHIFMAESAFDAMAFYELYAHRVHLDSSVFVSYGGSMSDSQYKGVTDYYPNAKPILLFDNDLNGNMYDIRAFALSKDIKLFTHLQDNQVHFKVGDKDFSIPREDVSLHTFLEKSGLRINEKELSTFKAKDAKDWNDALKENKATLNKTHYGI